MKHPLTTRCGWRLLIMVPLCWLGCSNPSVKVTHQEFQDQWPFTVEEGYLECTRNKAILFKAEGQSYMLYNPHPGTAEAAPVDAILKEHRSTEALVERGRQLCQ